MGKWSDDGNFIYIPHELGEFFTKPSDEGPTHELAMLRETRPWLFELEKSAVDFEKLRQPFLADGHGFMSALDNFLDATKWREFVLSGVLDFQDGHALYHVLQFAFREQVMGDTRAEVKALIRKKFDEDFKSLKRISSNTRLLEAIELRRNDTEIPKDMYRISRNDIVDMLRSSNSESPETSLSLIVDWIHGLQSMSLDEVTFGYPPSDESKEPWPLRGSDRWRLIGDNLRSLGRLVGANTSGPIVKALRDTVTNQGPTVNIMLARIDKLNTELREQGKVITALQFRHLLENLPNSLRDRKIEQVGAGTHEAAEIAEKWDRENQKERWLEFWREAVKQVYEVYLEKDSSSWTQPGGGAERAGPLAGLLNEYLSKARKMNKDHVVSWLALETSLGTRVKELYSDLSQVIHEYSGNKYTVDPLNFSPVDRKLLTALKPEQTEAEYINWKKEFRRYVWTPVKMPEKTEPDAGSRRISISNDDLTRRAGGVLASFESLPPFAIFLSNKLTDLTASLIPDTNKPEASSTPDTNKPKASSTPDTNILKITVKYKPNAEDLENPSKLSSVVGAAIVDLVGRIAITTWQQQLAIGKREQSFTSNGEAEQLSIGKHELSFTSFGEAEIGDEIEVIGTAEQLRVRVRVEKGKRDLQWLSKVELKATNGVIVGKGTFTAWKDRAAK
ncbi:hypothetical protein MMC07_009202 [Pseudocyphellaria aurata]|nr:hypothetical protein [Pseudocyphellaria aurata]